MPGFQDQSSLYSDQCKRNLFVTVSSIVASKISQPMHPPTCTKNPLVPSVLCAQYQLHAFVLNSGWSIIIIIQKHFKRDSKGPKRTQS